MEKHIALQYRRRLGHGAGHVGNNAQTGLQGVKIFLVAASGVEGIDGLNALCTHNVVGLSYFMGYIIFVERMNVKTDNQGKFLFLGEHAALDFANTLMAGASGPVETLNEYGDILNWLVLAELISREQYMELASGLKSMTGQEALLQKIREFRELWKANLDRLVTGKQLSSD